MNYQESLNYINSYFEFNTEARSYSHEVTEDGVFNKSHLSLMDKETIIDVAEDIRYEVRCEIGHLLG